MAESLRKIDVAGKAGRIAAHSLWERFRPERPTSLNSVPRSTEFLTVEWLSKALCRDVPGAKVVDYTLGEPNDGSTSRRAMTITYNDVGKRAGLPSDVFTKSTPSLLSRLVTVPTGLVTTEALFYNVIRPSLDIESPRGYYADEDPRSGRSMFLIEDVAKTRGATFGDPSTLYVDRKKAEEIVSLLAKVHGTFWQSPRFAADLSSVKDAESFQLELNQLVRFRSRSMVGVERGAHVSPAEFLRRRDEYWPALLSSLKLNRNGPVTLLHSDVHSRNWYVSSEGRMGLYDWQCITTGNWAIDVAYAISSALTVEDRRAWERELLDLYAVQLAESGGPQLSHEEVWLGYRQQLFHGLFFWLFTLGAGLLEPAMQPEHASLANVERMTHAAVDLEALESLEY